MKMIWFWFILVAVICVGGGILQAIFTKDRPEEHYISRDSQTEPWEGY